MGCLSIILNYIKYIFCKSEREKTKNNLRSIKKGRHIQFLYEFEIKDNDDYFLKKTDTKIEFNIKESNKINESKKRKVYKGKIDKEENYVVKAHKNNNGEIYYSNKDLLNDLINLSRAKKLSEKYTKKFQKNTDFIPMNFAGFYIGSEKEINTTELKNILLNEKSESDNGLNLIENFIDSTKFRLLVNEYCEVKYKDSKSIPWFMHWNWVETNGTYLICDLRGEINEGNNGYNLSSPSLQSKDKIYGNSDNGVYSLITFLAEHKHTEHCKNLPWPDDKHIKIAKNLKNKYNSSETCDNCKKIYDEIISSTFNSNNIFFLFLFLFLIILFLILPVFIFKKYIKKVIKKLNEVPNDNLNRDLEENLKENNKTSLTINKVNEQKYLSTNEDTDENSFDSIDKMEPPLIG